MWLPFDLHPEYPPEGIPREQLHARYGSSFHDSLRARFVDECHRPFVHALFEQKVFFGARDHVDDRVADAEDVKTGRGHS